MQRPTFCSILLKLSVFFKRKATSEIVITGGPLGTGNTAGKLHERLERKENNVNILDQVTQDYKKEDIPEFKVGDTLRVHVKIIEGQRERIQVFEGYVLKRQHGGINETFTVRKLSNGIGVEKTFPLHSPKIEKIEVVRKGRVRRAKLNYMRQRTGKAARIKSAE